MGLGSRLLRMLGTAGLVVSATVLATGGVAGAEGASSIDALGWWSRTSQGGLLGGGVLAPDVEEGQLLVEATPEGPTAVAALRATLPEGAGQPVLTLTAASETSADAPVLQACPTVPDDAANWEAAHGGDWGEAPGADCETASALGTADEGEWVFDLLGFDQDGQLDIVILAGEGSSFRIVFEEPTASSIEVTESNVEPDFEVPDFGGGDFGSDGGSTAGGTTSGGSTGGADSFGSSSSPSFSTPTPSSSEELSAPAPGPVGSTQGQGSTSPVVNTGNPVPPDPLPASSEAADGRLLGLLVALCAAGVLFWTTQMQAPPRQTLSRFAMAAGGSAGPGADEPLTLAEQIPEEKRMGGLGRFRRVRDTPARRLGT